MKSIKARWLAFAAVAVTVVGIAVVPSVASAESAETDSPASVDALCSANVVCLFGGTGYTSPIFDAYCEGGGVVWSVPSSESSKWGHSALNRCGNKTDWLRFNGTVVACMNPGGERPSPGPFNELVLSSEYGAKC